MHTVDYFWDNPRFNKVYVHLFGALFINFRKFPEKTTMILNSCTTNNISKINGCCRQFYSNFDVKIFSYSLISNITFCFQNLIWAITTTHIHFYAVFNRFKKDFGKIIVISFHILRD